VVGLRVGREPPRTHVGGEGGDGRRGLLRQGRDDTAATSLVEGARALESAGAFAVVVEGVPERVGAAVTESLDVPTIGIGAGPHCDGQVLVLHDLLGMSARTPKFVRRYAELAEVATAAVAAYAADVRSGAFPADAEVYH